MKEFRVRVWDKIDKEMYQPEEIACIDFFNREIAIDRAVMTADQSLIVASYSRDFEDVKLMLSADCKDTKEIEIFEGDILVDVNYRSFGYVVKYGEYLFEEDFGAKRRAIGFYLDATFEEDDPTFYHLNSANARKQYKVVGNIYATPELVKYGVCKDEED